MPPGRSDNFIHSAMCRNIKTLFNFEPPVTQPEVEAAALQYVRKISGFSKPSKANEAQFELAVDEIAKVRPACCGLWKPVPRRRTGKRKRRKLKRERPSDLATDTTSLSACAVKQRSYRDGNRRPEAPSLPQAETLTSAATFSAPFAHRNLSQ